MTDQQPQPIDPDHLNAVIASLRTQRNQALDGLAMAEGEIARRDREISALREEIERMKTSSMALSAA